MNQSLDDSNDVVISGISGVFPNCDNVEEFKEHLLAGNDMISSNSRCDMEGVRVGFLKTIDRFDYSFFQITHVQAQGMLISSRILLEKTFEALLDAGYNPREIKGKNIAVICGIWDTVDEGDPAKDRKAPDYTEAFGRMRFMITNRISYWLDVHGPSYPINTACSASVYAIDHAIKAIQSGQCEGAIVCGSNFCFSKIEYLKNNPLFSATGNCAPFDADANGYVKSEAAVVFFLQRRKDARRVYANLIHSATNSDGFKQEGPGCPSIKQQKKLYEQFYKEIDMDPQLISYIETHGTGTQVGDVVEGSSIDEFFCTSRETPLKIGSVKSNMGHGEAAAALCGITKLIVAFETGTIPANLKYNKPNPKISGLFNGHLEVVSKPTPLQGKYFALNSFGVGGSNGHVVLSPHTKVKNPNSLGEKIPYLVIASGRTEEAIDHILRDAQKNHRDAEYIRLLHEIFKYDISGHPQRGYVILQNNKPCQISKKFFSGEKRPIWFIFSGMGSQWPAMGKSLMEIPIFAESVQKSHQILQSKKVDLIKIITENNPQTFDNILHSFVGIAAIQIALVDILKKLNITPDGIIGHSVGELGCAYADGCFTAEQTILAAYYRGLVSMNTGLIHGTMAAVGKSYGFMKDHVPPEIDIACHNGPTSCTLSGPTQIMQDYMQKLNKHNVFAREVQTSNIAYHSRYIASLGPKMVFYLRKIIPKPKLRSDKWLCTSAPEHKWNYDEVRYCSAEYHTNNMLNPVYFEESYKLISKNAITIEIAPCGLLNAILKRSLPNTVDNVPLLMKNHVNSVDYLLNSFGQLYEMGCEMNLSHLYPPVEFPVSKSTPMISPVIKWQHEEQWKIDQVHSNFSQSSEKKFLFNPKSESTQYLLGHIIDGKNLYPGCGYLWLVVETVAMIENKKISEFNVVFESVRFEQAMTIHTNESVNFLVSVQQLYGHFEVKNNNATLVTGKVRVIENSCDEMVDVKPHKREFYQTDILPMDKNDFYKELRLRGCHHEGIFRKVEYFDYNRKYAELSWCNNFVSFLDMMGQVSLVLKDSRDLLIPTFIGKIVIDFKKHFETLESLDKENPRFPFNFYSLQDVMSSGGIQISGWKFTEIARQKINDYPTLEKHLFVPYITDKTMKLSSAIRICVQIAMKNTPITKAITYELLEQEYKSTENYISFTVVDALKNLPLTEGCVKLLINSETVPQTDTQCEILLSNETLPEDKSATLIILSNIQHKINNIKPILKTLRDDGFIITQESVNENIPFEDLGFNVCFSRNVNESEKIILINKKKKFKPIKKAIRLENASFSWMTELQTELRDLDSKKGENLVVFVEKEPKSGILGFFNSLKKEEREKNIKCFFIMDKDAPKFSLDDVFYKFQYDKNLCYNVYKDGKWGSYWHLELDYESDVECTHAFCKVEEWGNLSSFRWVEGSLDPNKYENLDEKSLIFVHYNGLNFKYVMLAVGKLHVSDTIDAMNRLTESKFNPIGEFSGKDVNGVRVMGIAGEGITTMVESEPYQTWKVPDGITLEEAASIPIIYSTVIYAFFVKMKLEKGCSVLIHSGSGGIGQAAINICLHYKCNIFTTVGTREKNEFIKKTFPQIPENHIGNSRDTSFLKMIKQQTNGEGVDVVLNSLSGDKILASLKCVAKCGHFLEIGKFDMAKNNLLELGPFLKNITFHSVQLDVLLSHDFVITRIKIYNKLQKMLDQGIIKPINRTVYEMNEVESAVRCMASGKHIGKLIIKIRNEEQENKIENMVHFKAKPHIYFNKEQSYVLLGGLGGFGIELADWLILRGARNIVLSSRTGIKNGYQSYRINLWHSYGVNVLITTADISQESGVIEILELANSLGPVAGIFNLAAILKDDLFSNQTEENFKVVTDPKALATNYLDQISRKICPFLEHFVIFSSAVCCYGNSEQTNYGFGNSVMERICEARHAENLPALAIQWGVVGEVGLVSEISPNAIIVGLAAQKIESCLKTLSFFMKQKHPIVNSKIITGKRRLGSDVINAVSNALGIKDLKSVSLTWTLPELGLDSILTLELKQILETELSIFLTPKDLQTMTFAKLYELKKEREVKSSTQKVPKELQRSIDGEVSKQPILRIPFTEGKIQKEQTINESSTFFVFPGIEGLAFLMEPLAKNLSSKVLCFQYHFVETENFYQNLIDYFSSYMLKTLQAEQEFHFIGYSYGTMIAVDVGKILEKEGRKGRIWLIDGSPTAMELLYKKIIARNSFEKEYNWDSKKTLPVFMFSEMIGNENPKNRLVDKLHHLLKTENNSSRTLLNSPCILIRCVQNAMDLPLDEFYGLTEYFKNPVEVYKIDGTDHSSIISHPKTAEIIEKSSPRTGFSTVADKL